MVNLNAFGGEPGGKPLVSPGARSYQPASTPRASARAFLNTAPAGSSGLPPLTAFPKDDGVGFAHRPHTAVAASTSEHSAARFMERLNTPRISRSHTNSPRIGRMSPAGHVLPSEPEAQAMILRQKKAFIAMHSKCAALEATNLALGSKLSILERETHCLRVRLLSKFIMLHPRLSSTYATLTCPPKLLSQC